MKQAILVVSFGTTHLDTLEKTICAVERSIQSANPDTPCFRAFTSRVIRKRLRENYGLCVDSVEEAMQKLGQQGFQRVLVQPTLLLPGEEFDRFREEVLRAAGELTVSIGTPLLWDDSDLSQVAAILKQSYPMDSDTVLLAMGHGTSHAADSTYHRLRSHMNALGMELCTVEGSIDFSAAVTSLLSRPQRRVHLIPLLLVAGDHSKNDMAGEEPDSLRSLLATAGFQVSYDLKGLGELEPIAQMYVRRVQQLNQET